MKKVVLAYSGGLDTSVCIPWLKEKKQMEVVTVSLDLGQEFDADALRQKALASGATSVYIENLQQEFLEQYVLPALRANAAYERKYLLATALSRPLIAKKLVEIAEKEGASVVAHGCSGKGNDQVRIELGIFSLNPELRVIAPLREWELKSRQEEIAYAAKHNIPVAVSVESPYSVDINVWGASIECGVLEDPWREPPEEIYQLTASPQSAPDKPTYIELNFKRGTPVGLNGRSCGMMEIVRKLNEEGGKNGVGREDLIENRLIGIKSREIYESPAGTILHLAHRELEALTLDKETLHFKELISTKYGELIYYGLWHSSLRDAFDAFIEKTQEVVSGTIRVKLHKGKCEMIGRRSEYSLYNENLATYGISDTFNRTWAEGFIELWGLPLKLEAMRKKCLK
ncbi:argininosuccinate synthase [candidate division NPL-UPA2 bacterium Unc8]|uniref:Argininosuccinate synthase n=1 Tax=candidate division NPL-UPA2 bacterium Unc8 TaxID=1980939 RepID=A0A399FWH6_UNCN2|nr:Argininosuccinate synthase [Bacillota bacterium]RII00775.1 MAG: argininosuccinate synthase [candidate division NPL-UPA2 bacterium Unc8]